MNIELFPCSGGMAEGFRRAGIVFDVAFDRDLDACESYEANLGRRPIRMDVRDLATLARHAWSPGPVDLLVADPPCTPWSRAGKRQGLADERDMLSTTCDLIETLQPRVWVLGNVPGLDDAPNADAVDRTIGRLRDRWCINFARLDAADFGVPQHRVRPFWVGHPYGTECPRLPAPTHGDAASTAQMRIDGVSVRPWVTCRDALADLPASEWGRPVRVRVRNESGDVRHHDDSRPARTVTAAKRGGDTMLVANLKHAPGRSDKPSKTIASSRPGNGASVLLHDHHRPSALDEPSHVIKTNGGRASGNGSVLVAKSYRASTKGPQGLRTGDPDRPSATVTSSVPRIGAGEGQVLSWPWDRPSTTLQCDDRIAPTGHHDESFLSGANAVVLSERAAKRLQGLPDSWVLSGRTKASRWSQLGMLMPPHLAEIVARAIAPLLTREAEGG